MIILTLTSNHALNQFSMNLDLKMKDKVIKLLAFTINIEEPLHDLGVGKDFLSGTQKEITINKKSVKLSFIKN